MEPKTVSFTVQFAHWRADDPYGTSAVGPLAEAEEYTLPETATKSDIIELIKQKTKHKWDGIFIHIIIARFFFLLLLIQEQGNPLRSFSVLQRALRYSFS